MLGTGGVGIPSRKTPKRERKSSKIFISCIKNPSSYGQDGLYPPPSPYWTGKCPFSALGIGRSKLASAITTPQEDGLISIT